jgi:hypothetical protein
MTLALVALALPVVAHPVAAQSTLRYRKRLDALTKRWLLAKQAAVRAAEAEARRTPNDTIRIGPLAMLGDGATGHVLHDALDPLVPKLSAIYGDQAARLERYPFVVRPVSPGEAGKAQWFSIVQVDPSGAVRDEARVTAGMLRQTVASRAAEIMTRELDPDAQRWLGAPVPLDTLTTSDWAAIRVELVTASSFAVRSCFAVSTASCRKVLALEPLDDPVTAWYDNAERQELVRRLAGTLRRRGDEATYDRCATGGVATVCDSLLRLIPRDRVPAPIRAGTRASLLRYAMARGGTGAFDRFARSSGGIANRLAGTAGMPIDSLMASWRSHAAAAHIGTTTLSLATALTALLWAAFCLGLALRSSRWR